MYMFLGDRALLEPPRNGVNCSGIPLLAQQPTLGLSDTSRIYRRGKPRPLFEEGIWFSHAAL